MQCGRILLRRLFPMKRIWKRKSLPSRCRHLRQLVQGGFLASYSVTKARNANGFVVTFRPGSAFFSDYDRFYRNRNQGGLQFDFHGDRKIDWVAWWGSEVQFPCAR
jgi:hypothetical protein